MSATSTLLGTVAADPSNLIEWFTDREGRARSGAIPDQIWITVWHSVVAVVVASALMIPLAVGLAHHRKAELISTWFVNIGRAVPTITVLGVAVIVSLRNGYGLEPWPILVALVLLGLPPIFTNTYAGVCGVDPGAVSAAQAMGFGHLRTMRRVELPLALPVIMAGVRTAAVQIIATEPLGAFFGGECLGAYIRQGLGNRDIYQVQAGALLVTAVAVGAELVLAATGRTLTPRGIRRREQHRRWRRRPAPI
jgi:osmoprotectant transport system permease protein